MSNRVSTCRVVCWRLSLRCNRACAFCLSRSGPRKRNPDHEPRAMLRRLHELGVEKVSYSGGEPTLYEPIGDLIQLGQDLGMAQVLTTNGDRLLEEVPKWVCGLEHLRLSFYGGRALHDALMGAGHYDSQLQLAERLHVEHGVSVSANYMLSRKSVRDIGVFLESAADYGLYHVVVQTYIPNRRAHSDREHAFEAVGSILEDIDHLLRRASSRFIGGIQLHDFTERDWLIVLDEEGNLALPSNSQEPDHVLGQLNDDRFVRLSGSRAQARVVLEEIWTRQLTTSGIRQYAPHARGE